MFTDYWWAYLLALMVGLAAGFLFCRMLYSRRNIGTLRVDRSIPEDGAYFFLEVTNVKRITDGATITMKVKEQNYIPQESQPL